MVHDQSCRAAARDLLAESDVVASDELTDALAELRSVGQHPAPPMSPELAEAMRRAAGSGAAAGPCAADGAGKVIPLPSGRVRRRGAAVGGAVVLAMVAGMGGVAALGPGSAVETAIDSVIRWAAPTESTAPASDEQPLPARDDSVLAPKGPSAGDLPVPGQLQSPEAVQPGDTGSEEGSNRPSVPTPAPTSQKHQPKDLGEAGRRVVPRVEVPQLPVPIPDPVTEPRSVMPVDPNRLPVPRQSPTPTPSSGDSR